ncbi:MAG: hypothetical protein J3K34DRAFT_442001 [Monoraphidium minutum]|nr:MAG: hypothetical protein J3K34DRAFT_442001 [Monoraphidium minutum]
MCILQYFLATCTLVPRPVSSSNPALHAVQALRTSFLGNSAYTPSGARREESLSHHPAGTHTPGDRGKAWARGP